MLRRASALAVIVWLAAACGFAQSPATATLRVTVVDPSNAVVVGASVSASPADDAASGATVSRGVTADGGIATIANLTPGRYTDPGGVPGFRNARRCKDVRIRRGENKQVAVLPIPKLEQSVTVDRTSSRPASDPHGPVVRHDADPRSRSRRCRTIPQQLQQQLQDMAGPGAVIRIDGFEGGRAAGQGADPLDPHLARSVRRRVPQRGRRLDRDHHAARDSARSATSPASVSATVRSAARSPFVADERPGEQHAASAVGLDGGLIKNKSSFNVNVFGNELLRHAESQTVALPERDARRRR